jgi:FAD dependent oxidoreductase TIGR03364
MHAWFALAAGYEVTQIERDPMPMSASVRNFGLVWVSGRAAGAELDLAIRARQLWGQIGTEAQIGFRANGSLTFARSEIEVELLQRAALMPDAAIRGFEYLSAAQVRQLEPNLAGDYLGALRCTQDGALEPKLLFPGLREKLLTNPNYHWVTGANVTQHKILESGHEVRTMDGRTFAADRVVFCVGAYHEEFLAEYLTGAPLRKVFLQMGSTKPTQIKVGHSIADGDSMRYYPAFKDVGLELLPPQTEIAAEHAMQLLMVQRFDGSYTIGDTHVYQEPFSHEIVEEPYEHLLTVIAGIHGRKFEIGKRWSGVYSQATGSEIYHRQILAPGAEIVTGVGGRGNTISPAVAEETINSWAL